MNNISKQAVPTLKQISEEAEAEMRMSQQRQRTMQMIGALLVLALIPALTFAAPNLIMAGVYLLGHIAFWGGAIVLAAQFLGSICR